jgi:protein-tyrosine kinase
MSRNFQLLQEIGGDEELFRTSGPIPELVPVSGGEPGPEFDQAARDRILQHASLPNVLEAFDEPAPESDPASVSALGLDDGLDGRPSSPAAVEFRTPESPTTPIGTPAIPRETGRSTARERSEPQVGALPQGSQWANGSSSEPLYKRETTTRSNVPWKPSSVLNWMDQARAGIARWNRKMQQQISLRQSEVEAIARAEQMKLVHRIFPGAGQDSPRVVLFSAVEGSSGCAGLCARIAEILADRGEGPVCLVDANFDSPSLHTRFGTDNSNGLAEAALESRALQAFIQQIREPDLWLMPSGRGLDRLTFSAITDGVRTRMTELRAAFQYVLVQAGPVHPETSAMLISRWTDGVVLVVEANSTRREFAKQMKENVLAANVSLLGVVLNNRTFPVPDAIYRRL